MIDNDKRIAAYAAVEEIEPGMLVGLGTGTTAHHAIVRLGEKVAVGLRIRAVATSIASEELARQAGIPLAHFAEVAGVDLTIDGADQIDHQLRAIKGAGGAMLREKVVAAASTRMIVVADGSKRVAALGAQPVPVEILPFAQCFVVAALHDLGAEPTLRVAGAQPYRTDQDNLIADCRFADLSDPPTLAARLSAIPGVLGHGLFVEEVDAAYIGHDGRVTRLERP